jgi:hypothetical protein
MISAELVQTEKTFTINYNGKEYQAVMTKTEELMDTEFDIYDNNVNNSLPIEEDSDEALAISEYLIQNFI